MTQYGLAMQAKSFNLRTLFVQVFLCPLSTTEYSLVVIVTGGPRKFKVLRDSYFISHSNRKAQVEEKNVWTRSGETE